MHSRRQIAQSSTLVIAQTVIVFLSLLLFYAISVLFDGVFAFLLAMLAYWTLLWIAIMIVFLTDARTLMGLRWFLRQFRRIWLTPLVFLPAIASFLIAFLPSAAQLNVRLLFAITLVSVFNGFTEELFCRGLTLAKYFKSHVWLFLSTLLFAMHHFAFGLLPLAYYGGVGMLVLSAAFMGFLWLYVSLATRNIVFTIFAHILVNVFAFTQLFTENAFLLSVMEFHNTVKSLRA